VRAERLHGNGDDGDDQAGDDEGEQGDAAE
jgi:hypothetical protein